MDFSVEVGVGFMDKSRDQSRVLGGKSRLRSSFGVEFLDRGRGQILGRGLWSGFKAGG